MNMFVFPSVARPTWRYRLCEHASDMSSRHWRLSRNAISDCLSTYDTMGDGETQHCPAAVVQVDDFRDVVASFLPSLHRIPVSMESMPGWLRWFWRTGDVTEEQIQFALSLRYHEQKTVYYCLERLSKSLRIDRRHDKRWEKLWWYEGNCPIERVMRILCVDSFHSRPTGIIAYVTTVLRIADVVDKPRASILARQFLQRGPGVFQGLPDDTLRDMITQFELISTFVSSLSTVIRVRQCSLRAMESLCQPS